jgi:hypothetical protein
MESKYQEKQREKAIKLISVLTNRLYKSLICY